MAKRDDPDPQGATVASAGSSEVGAPSAVDGGALARGSTIDRYLIVGKAGAGGMGVVYTAYDPDLDRKVAIKLLLTKEGSKEARVRLLREAQAMAKLSHPNVVAVHDVGTVGEQVFVAMEYVEGQSLATWLREKQRPWREVLRMFIEAGRGLAAAHAAGVLHRDFKPENVMVGKDGQARVLDFGLARAVDAATVPSTASAEALDETAAVGGVLATPLTRTGTMMGTPAYMAPEQFQGEVTDARTDQFSFCVALYEGLYGERPFVGENLLRLMAEVVTGKVREAPRGTEVPTWLRRVLLLGLKVKREERYPSIADLLADLRRDPAIRQKRWLAAVGTLGILVAAVFGMKHLLDQRRLFCRAGPEKLAGVWDGASKQAVREALLATRRPFAADAWRGVERAFDEYAERWKAGYTDACEATHRRGEQSAVVLDLRMECLRGRLQDVKALGDVLATADEKVAEKAVQAAAGLPGLGLCADVEALRAPVRPPRDPATRATVEALRVRLAGARALNAAGKYTEALAKAGPVSTAAQETRYAPMVAEALEVLGNVQDKSGDAKGAEAALEEAVWAAEAGRHDEVAAQASSELVFVVGYREARYAEGARWGRLADAALQRLGRAESPARALLLNNLGAVSSSQGKLDEARAYRQQALNIREKALGKDHPDVAATLNNLSSVSYKQGRYDEAHAYGQRALAVWEKALGPEHPDVSVALNNLGNAAYASGRNSEARAYYQRALAVWEKALGPEHPRVAMTLDNIGNVVGDMGNGDEGLAYHRRSLAILEKALGPQHPDVLMSLNHVANGYLRLGKNEEALATYRRALTIGEKALGASHPVVADTLLGFGRAEVDSRRPAEAVAHLERALVIFAAGDPADLAGARFALARALWDSRGDRSRARKLADQAREGYAASGDARKKDLVEVGAWLMKHSGG